MYVCMYVCMYVYATRPTGREYEIVSITLQAVVLKVSTEMNYYVCMYVCMYTFL